MMDVHSCDFSRPPVPQIWNSGHTCDNEPKVRWPITPEVVNAHARQFTSGLANFRLVSTIVLPFLVQFQSNLERRFTFPRKQPFLLVTQPEVIYAHARNLTFGLLTNLLKLPLNIALQAKCSPPLGDWSRSIHFR